MCFTNSFHCETCVDSVCLSKIKGAGFSKFSYEEKVNIVSKGRCLPDLELTQKKGNTTRKFHTSYYEKYDWLTGCVHANSLFCFPCLLFSTSSSVWNDTGYVDLNNFPNAAKKHEQTEKHLESCIKFYTFGKNRIETSLNHQLKLDIEKHNGKVDRNRNIFQRLVDIVCFLGKQELAFRGHDESSTSLNRGNYLELVNLLAKYDGVLETHLENATSSFTGLSNRTQNDLISSVASVMNDTIKREIKATDFVAVMVDETPDVSGREQLVFILRYFVNAEVVDRFIKYVDVSSDRTAATLSSTILEILKEYDCLSKLIAQTYDGAAVLSSDLNGVQALVRQKCPLALYVWCSAHILNLILSKTFERISETKRFFSTIKSLANFFHGGTKRMAHFQEFADMKKLPRVAETRWTYHSRSVNVILSERTHLVELFEDMQENTDNKWDGDTLQQITAFLFNLKEFEFNFFLKTFSDIFAETDVLYDVLQKKTTDIVYCVRMIKQFESFMQSYRDKFEINYHDATLYSGPPKRKRNISDPKTHYKRVFVEIIDNILSESRRRYQNITDLKFFQLLSNEKLDFYIIDFPEELLSQLVSKYEDIFDIDRLRNELRCVYKSPDFKDKCVFKIIQYLYTNKLDNVFPQVLRLSKLIATIPVSSASAERSFSSLKRIHTYLRNTQGQQRLTEISLISIEKQLLSEIKRSHSFYDDVLKIYLKKDRRVDLIYK
ncbi:zinc finger MYM-type protein 1-like [Phthorimaea operculella]|nr:zinc finger MYM-type protein 1-like [Phthorimaea operculella]